MLVMMCHDGPSRHIKTNTIDGENDDDDDLSVSNLCSLSGCWEQNGGRDTDEESEWSPAAASIQPCWAGGDRDDGGDDGDHDDGDGDIMMMKEVATVRPTTPI